MDLLTARIERFPEMHVYHYAPYEPTALKRLMGRHATREDEVDRLLRGGILVDLFRAVRQGLRASVESYSIKRLDRSTPSSRDLPARRRLEHRRVRGVAPARRPGSAVLRHPRRIARYNRDDVRSTLGCATGWRSSASSWQPPRCSTCRVRPRSDRGPGLDGRVGCRVQAVAAELTAGVPDDPAERDEEQRAGWLLAQLLAWHRRESKVAYWEFFHRLGLDEADLTADEGALGPLEVVGPVGDPWRPTPRSKPRQTWRYQFAAAGLRHRLAVGAVRPEAPPATPRRAMEGLARQGRPARHRRQGVRPGAQLAARRRSAASRGARPARHVQRQGPARGAPRLGEWVAANGVDADGPWRAGRDLLLRRPPPCGQEPGKPLRHEGEDGLEAARRLVLGWTTGTLAIQGPPGSGKTYTGARMAVELLARRPAHRHQRDEPQGHHALPGRGALGGGRRRRRSCGTEGVR